MTDILTCVYCGIAYPEGTPPWGSQILTDHIKVCEKHPLREAEEKIKKLRKVLSDLIGASTREELEKMELVLRSVPGVKQDKIIAINAIHILIETI
uniref:Uncharacterized protein n=1 Tax=viral metagenome TaxID=1070528 RepID=A0A6H2A106_9ZZZZ